MDRTRAWEERDARLYPTENRQPVHPVCHVKLPTELLGTRWINHLSTGTRLIVVVTGSEVACGLVDWIFSDGSRRHSARIAEEVLNRTLVLVEDET